MRSSKLKIMIMKLLKNTLLILSALSIICFVLLCGAIIVETKIMDKPVAAVFGYSIVNIAGGAGSMYPTLKPYDTVLLKKKDSYEAGDVVTYRDGDSLVTHRIVETVDGGYKTKGDNTLNSVDAVTLSDDMIIGAMVGGGAMGGFEKLLLSPWGALLIAAVFFTGYEVLSIVIDQNKTDKKNAVSDAESCG